MDRFIVNTQTIPVSDVWGGVTFVAISIAISIVDTADELIGIAMKSTGLKGTHFFMIIFFFITIYLFYAEAHRLQANLLIVLKVAIS